MLTLLLLAHSVHVLSLLQFDVKSFMLISNHVSYFVVSASYTSVCTTITLVSVLLERFCYMYMQDTLLALESLTEFSYRQTNRAFYNLQLRFECTSNTTWSHTVQLDRTNFANLYSFGVC